MGHRTTHEGPKIRAFNGSVNRSAVAAGQIVARRLNRVVLAIGMLTAGRARAQTVASVQTETDEYTRYEIQGPAERSFRIRYDVSATTAGARHYFNGIREGATATVHGV
ncbi:MAG: hypothetical protein ABI647_05585, partial [Gemmatimonadota bacterium]